VRDIRRWKELEWAGGRRQRTKDGGREGRHIYRKRGTKGREREGGR